MDQTTTSNQRSNGKLAFACLLLTIGLSVAWAGGKKTRKWINKYIIGQKNVWFIILLICRTNSKPRKYKILYNKTVFRKKVSLGKISLYFLLLLSSLYNHRITFSYRDKIFIFSSNNFVPYGITYLKWKKLQKIEILQVLKLFSKTLYFSYSWWTKD